MCRLLCVFLAFLLAGAWGSPAGRSSQDFLAAERKFADEENKRPQEVSVIGNVAVQVDPFTEGRIRNVKLISDVPQIISMDPNFAHLNLGVIVSLGNVVVEGEVNISSSSTTGFVGNITLTYGNVSATGVAQVVVVQDLLQVTNVDLMYSPQNRSARVTFNSTRVDNVGQAAETFFEGSVERMAVGEMDRRVVKQLNEALKGVNSLEVFGDAATLQKSQNVNPVSNVNFMVDTILAMIMPKVPSTVNLDDVNKPFKKTFMFVPFFGQLLATNGTLKDLKTLRRTSDVYLNVTSTGIRLTGAMGLDTLQFAYNYDISVLDMGPSGRLEGSVGNNSLSFALKVTFDGRGNCTVNVEELRVERLDDFKIKVTGLGILNWLASSITTSVVNDAKDKIIAHIETSINRNIKGAANKVGFCNVLQGL